ncbi:hypothetical protein LJB75_00120 [Bacteroidales bacterium OttesenSCG-928-L19]|nr:hypothetical protein [Bacteroidales bacterium OttesenSCG-928-L19]
MKRKLMLLFVNVIFFSCTNQCIENADFKQDYFSRLDKIVEYDNLTLTGNAIPTEYWMDFYSNTQYLHFLSGHEFRYDATEPPGYSSDLYLKADIRDLEKWYNKNKCGMTKEKADSIVNLNEEYQHYK